MFCCNIEHKQIGQNRVGRDDHESRYKSYEFRPRKGHKMSQRVISKINLLLETKLEYQEEKMVGTHTLRDIIIQIVILVNIFMEVLKVVILARQS